MNNLPEFKPNFSYSNIGNLVGDLVYAKEATRQDGSVFGIEFLLNVKGFGSCNVRIPKVDTAQASLNAYSVEAKPKVRAGLTRVEQFTSQRGVTYTSFTTFVELGEPTTVSGQEMDYKVAGRVGGELFKVEQKGDVVHAYVITFPMDRDGKKRATNARGEMVEPQVLHFEAVNPEIAQQVLQAGVGANVEFGYYYYNKQDFTTDDFGMTVGTGQQIQRLEIGRVVVKQQGQAVQGNAGSSNQQGSPFGSQGGQAQQQGSPFGAPQNNQQQNVPFIKVQQPNQQQQQQSNPWGGQQNEQQGNAFGGNGQGQPTENNYQAADQHFQQNQGNENNYPFGGQEVPNNDPMQQGSPFGGNPWGGQQGGNGFPFGN